MSWIQARPVAGRLPAVSPCTWQMTHCAATAISWARRTSGCIHVSHPIELWAMSRQTDQSSFRPSRKRYALLADSTFNTAGSKCCKTTSHAGGETSHRWWRRILGMAQNENAFLLRQLKSMHPAATLIFSLFCFTGRFSESKELTAYRHPDDPSKQAAPRLAVLHQTAVTNNMPTRIYSDQIPGCFSRRLKSIAADGRRSTYLNGARNRIGQHLPAKRLHIDLLDAAAVLYDKASETVPTLEV